MKRKTHVDINSLVLFRLKMVKVGINWRLEAAHKIIMEISLLIMEKSWNNHGILISNFCGNPDIWAWWPSWSCDQHHVIRFSFPCT